MDSETRRELESREKEECKLESRGKVGRKGIVRNENCKRSDLRNSRRSRNTKGCHRMNSLGQGKEQ